MTLAYPCWSAHKNYPARYSYTEAPFRRKQLNATYGPKTANNRANNQIYDFLHISPRVACSSPPSSALRLTSYHPRRGRDECNAFERRWVSRYSPSFIISACSAVEQVHSPLSLSLCRCRQQQPRRREAHGERTASHVQGDKVREPGNKLTRRILHYVRSVRMETCCDSRAR